MSSTNFVYNRDGKLYINVTNKCTNNCDFCIRHNHDGVGGKDLWLEREPTFKDIKEQLPQNILTYSEVVFCGFGEPTCNIDVVRETGRYLKGQGAKTRINTNGQANLLYKKDVTEKLVGAIDVVNVSLNASNAKKYQQICKSVYGEVAFDALLEFALLCQEKGLEVILSVVDIIGNKEVEECKKLCKKNNLKLRVRTYE